MHNSPAETEAQVIARLDRALARDSLPVSYRDWAGRLLDRLREPVRVMVIGRAGAGKSTLIDRLLGRRVVSGQPGPPELHVVQGQTARIYVEYEDGTGEWRGGALGGQHFDRPVARACQEWPDASLEQQSLIEIGLPLDPAEAHHVLSQAVTCADILLWCSPSFGTEDRALLDKVPDRLRDHGFLVLTKADRLRGTEGLSGRLAVLEHTIAADFLGLFPVAAGDDLVTLDTDSPDTNSGSQRLVRDLARQIELGRAADLDQARMILRQDGHPAPGARSAASAADPRETATATPPARNIPAPDPVPSDPAPAPAPAPAMTRATGILREAGQDLLARFDVGPGPDERQVLDHCARTLDRVADALAETGDQGEASDLIEEGQEMMLLIQMERGASSAEDAVTLMLQLRQDLSALVPA